MLRMFRIDFLIQKENDGDEEQVFLADSLASQIQTKAGLGEFSGEIIATIPEVPFVVPR